jgi:hypothetical protein
VNISLLIRATRAAAACNGLVGFDEAMMPPLDSEAFVAIMRPYIDAQLPDVIEESAMKKVEAAARRAGSEARRVAMGSMVEDLVFIE